MKKMFFLAATAALALSSCTSDDLVQAPEVNGAEDGAVVFSAYQGRVTRDPVAIGQGLADLANNGGFGVFAYEQGTADFATYSANSNYPNFFYNQQVWENTYNSATGHKGSTLTAASTTVLSWKYSPIKYFSNNVGAKHSFFAYAPYSADVKSVFALGKAPAIRYNIAENYDLLYAKSEADKNLNMPKQALTNTINFNFEHALSKVSIYAAPFVDEVHDTDDHTTGEALDAYTKIYVRSVKFVGTIASQGLLNLGDGTWTVEAADEAAYQIAGVADPITNTYNTSDPGNYLTIKENILAIPSGTFKIQIVYDVVTTDENNPANSSTITNTILSDESYSLEQGKVSKFYLDLGMKTVQFNVKTVNGWGAVSPDENVDLPNNDATSNRR